MIDKHYTIDWDKEEKYWKEKNKKIKREELLKIFRVTRIDVAYARRRYYKNKLTSNQKKIDKFENFRINLPGNECFIDMVLSVEYERQGKLKKTIKYFNKHIKQLKEKPENVQHVDYDIEYIKENADIEIVMGEPAHKKEPNRWWFLCPFHNDTNPSLLWNVKEKYFHCFVCGQSGDIFTIYQHLTGDNFKDALKNLSTH